MVYADSASLEQILMNLVINALDAMPEGGHLDIETANVEVSASAVTQHSAIKPGRYTRVIVKDTGHGMSQETVERILEPFYTTRQVAREQGSGLRGRNCRSCC
jgi:signal transduction histidine kinase